MANKHTYKNKKGEEKQMDINVIPDNMEKYMAFVLGKHLLFVESLQLMSSRLGKLVSNLPNDAFKYTSEEIKNDKKLKLMKQKGVYPYDYMDPFKGTLPNFDPLDGKSIVWTIDFWTNFSTRRSVYNIENAQLDD